MKWKYGWLGINIIIHWYFKQKKLKKEYDAYVDKLRYPNNTKKQINTLLNYAKSYDKIPFYHVL